MIALKEQLIISSRFLIGEEVNGLGRFVLALLESFLCLASSTHLCADFPSISLRFLLPPSLGHLFLKPQGFKKQIEYK